MLAFRADCWRALWLAKPLCLLLAIQVCMATSARAGADTSEGPSFGSTSSDARWVLPPSNLSRRSAVLGATSHAEHILVAQRSAISTVQTAPSARTRPESPPTDGEPNVFGSVALAVMSTPLDGKWQRSMVYRNAQLASWTRAIPVTESPNPMLMLAEVNRWVNRRIRFVDDGPADHWSGAAETLRRQSGDCEDFALTKLQLLTALGFDPDRLYLVIARDLVRRADHAVLVVRLDDRFVVLDNMTDEILDSHEVTDYRPIMSYSASGRWIHGYERPTETPVQFASNIAP